VSVYVIGEFSKEFCGGPHVQNTREIGGSGSSTRHPPAPAYGASRPSSSERQMSSSGQVWSVGRAVATDENQR
jgi:hypothetical protein